PSSRTPTPARRRNDGRGRLDLEFDTVILDDGVGQELPRHVVDSRPGLGGIGLVERQYQVLAGAHLGDRVETERVQPASDGQSRRVVDHRLERDKDLYAVPHTRPRA